MKVKIEKLVFGGQGLCRAEGKIVFVWGGLPGEEVEIKIIKKKKNFIEGVVEKVLVSSPDRIAPLDDHYLSCSPWQTMSYEKENEWKKVIAEETYRRICPDFAMAQNRGSSITTRGRNRENLNLEVVAPKKEIGYRNKMEYNFSELLLQPTARPLPALSSAEARVQRPSLPPQRRESERGLSLAFHDRGTHWLRPIDRCTLGSEIIQNASEEIVDNLRMKKIPFSILKSLIVRSDDSGKAAAALFVKDMDFCRKGWQTPPNLPLERGGSLKGLQIYYSNPQSPASVATELLSSEGDSELMCELSGVKLKFGLMSFFQINPPIFVEALKVIGKHIDGGRVVDYYSGVGAISLALHGKYDSALLIEENQEASDFANENILLNKFDNVTVQNIMAEASNVEIGENDIVILDPPRAGLHTDMIKHLLKKLPRKIIYLSCGLDTHARDVSYLSVRYRPVEWKLFNFFPRTPHIEGLCILEKI